MQERRSILHVQVKTSQSVICDTKILILVKYNYIDISCMHSNTASQFTSIDFMVFHLMVTNKLSLVIPKKKAQNHFVECTWHMADIQYYESCNAG